MKITINLAPQTSESAAVDINLDYLKSAGEAFDAIEKIENDPSSVVGGRKAWAAGGRCELTQKAKNKIKAIERLIEKKWPGSDYVDD